MATTSVLVDVMPDIAKVSFKRHKHWIFYLFNAYMNYTNTLIIPSRNCSDTFFSVPLLMGPHMNGTSVMNVSDG